MTSGASQLENQRSEFELCSGWTETPVARLIERHFSGPSPDCEERQIASDDEWAATNRDARRIPLKQADRDARRGVYPYYGASGVIDFIDDYLFDGQFVLIGEDGENLRSRQLPLAFIATGKFWVNNHAHILEPIPGTDVRFLATILEAQDYIPWLLGSAQPKLTQKNLEQVPLLIPAAPEQVRIADLLDALDSRLGAESANLRKQRQLKSGLMTDLLTGRVRVPPDIGA